MTDPNSLINGYLDDLLSDAQLRELNDWIVADPQNARQFAVAVLLHDRLGDQWSAQAVLKGNRSWREACNLGRRFRPWGVIPSEWLQS